MTDFFGTKRRSRTDGVARELSILRIFTVFRPENRPISFTAGGKMPFSRAEICVPPSLCFYGVVLRPSYRYSPEVDAWPSFADWARR